MSDIQVGQVWVRRKETLARNFPANSWKVQIDRIIDNRKILHHMVEYNGELREGGKTFSMDKTDFLLCYYLEE